MGQKLRVVLRDTVTGDEAEYAQNVPAGVDLDTLEFVWFEGNDGCDCNRGSYLASALGKDDPRLPCGDSRVVIVSARLDDGDPLPGWSEVG